MPSKSLLSFSLVLISVLVAGCSSTMQIVRAPLISPVVVPAPNQFKMNAAVKNGTSQPQGGWVLFVYTEYGASLSNPQQPPTTNQSIYYVPTLATNESWALSDYDVTKGNANAPCLKDQCTGHSWLVLCPYQAAAWNQCPQSNTPDRCVHVWWQPNGDLKTLVVKDCT